MNKSNFKLAKNISASILFSISALLIGGHAQTQEIELYKKLAALYAQSRTPFDQKDLLTQIDQKSPFQACVAVSPSGHASPPSSYVAVQFNYTLKPDFGPLSPIQNAVFVDILKKQKFSKLINNVMKFDSGSFVVGQNDNLFFVVRELYTSESVPNCYDGSTRQYRTQFYHANDGALVSEIRCVGNILIRRTSIKQAGGFTIAKIEAADEQYKFNQVDYLYCWK